MSHSHLTNLCPISITNADPHLLQQVADIEQKVQLDSWNQQQIDALLQQDINQCWGIVQADQPQQQDKQLVAYCLISTVFEVAEVLHIGTHPDFQRRGLAASLLQALIQDMPHKQLDRILLEVRADNTKAIALYRKMGFEVIHTRKGYYAIPAEDGSIERRCDALIMQYERQA